MRTVETTTGRIAGVSRDGIDVHLGIPYGAAPQGALRFQSPKPVRPWSGTLQADAFGPSAIQGLDPMVGWIYTPVDLMAEDCLSLNVWAPSGTVGLPVVVWIHGGGFRTGSTAMPLFDGSRLAAAAQVVLVTINHRNSTLGWLSHPDLTDPDTGVCANWALQDQAQALAWVRDNATAFGGDPDRVTVMGQSGGAINAVMLAQNPATAPLIAQLILLSPPYIAPPGFADLDDAAILAEAVARELGTTVRGLRDIPGDRLCLTELQQWREGRVANRTGRALRGPVADGRTLIDWPSSLDWPAIPILLGYTRNEGAFWTDLVDPDGRRLTPQPPPNDAAERGAAGAFLARTFGDNDRLGAIVEAYFEAYAGNRDAAPNGVLAEVIGDGLLRQYGLSAAAAPSSAPRYVFDYALPVLPPGRGSPHCCELPVLFGTFDQPHYRLKVGEGDEVRSLSAALMASVGAFARDGAPAGGGIAAWPAFDPATASTMTLGGREDLFALGRTPGADLMGRFRDVALRSRP